MLVTTVLLSSPNASSMWILFRSRSITAVIQCVLPRLMGITHVCKSNAASGVGCLLLDAFVQPV
eukprot:564199-Rhodomonas_salina.1